MVMLRRVGRPKKETQEEQEATYTQQRRQQGELRKKA